MLYYKAQHETFIRAIIRHGDHYLAYRQAYPKAAKESAYTAAIRLLRQPHIKERVAQAMQQHRQQQQRRVLEQEARRLRLEEEDLIQKRIWLARVVRGQVKKKRNISISGRVITVHEPLCPFITIAAIELDCKYEAGYNPKIILDRQFARLYARATRVVGPCGVNGSNRQTGKSLAGKKAQNASKKLTDSSPNPHRSTVCASNKKPATVRVCNKIETPKTAPKQVSSVYPIKAVISNEERNLLNCSGEAGSETSGDFSLHSASLHSVRNDEIPSGVETTFVVTNS
jgi:hypothetical protein